MEESNIDDFIHKLVKEAGVESPSTKFTETLLSKIEAMEDSGTATVYTPLISKFTWWVLALILIVFSIFAVFGEGDTGISWLEKMNVGPLPKFEVLDTLSDLTLPNTILYSLPIFAVFAIVQMALLKQRFNRRYSLQ